VVGKITVTDLTGLAAVLLLVTACQSGPRQSMIHLEPPANWEASLSADRERKDAYMAEDSDTPLLAEDVADFKGLEYFPPNPDYYLVGQISFYPEAQPLQITTTAGLERPGEKIGWISFELDGAAHKLQVYRMLDNPPGAGFFLPFKDQTAGTETYPSGRYLELLGPQGGPYVLDFNRAYNPYCAYGAPERFACPVTPRENDLDLSVSAGERGFKYGKSE
jgi:uncharacterized protein (DUF1684 family)